MQTLNSSMSSQQQQSQAQNYTFLYNEPQKYPQNIAQQFQTQFNHDLIMLSKLQNMVDIMMTKSQERAVVWIKNDMQISPGKKYEDYTEDECIHNIETQNKISITRVNDCCQVRKMIDQEKISGKILLICPPCYILQVERLQMKQCILKIFIFPSNDQEQSNNYKIVGSQHLIDLEEQIKRNRQVSSKYRQLKNYVLLPNQIQSSKTILSSLTLMYKNPQCNLRQKMICQLQKLMLKCCQINEQHRDKKNDVINFLQQLKKQHLTPQKAINWYTSGALIYKLINNLLRSARHPSQLFYLQPYLYDLYCGIQKLSQKNYKSFICYRGGRIYKQQAQQLAQHTGEFIQNLGFLSASLSNQKTRVFSQNAIFHIKVNDWGQKQYINPIFTEAKKHSHYFDQQQILFNPLNIFKINQVQKIQEKYYIYMQCGIDIKDSQTKLFKNNSLFTYYFRYLHHSLTTCLDYGSILFESNLSRGKNEYLQKYEKIAKTDIKKMRFLQFQIQLELNNLNSEKLSQLYIKYLQIPMQIRKLSTQYFKMLNIFIFHLKAFTVHQDVAVKFFKEAKEHVKQLSCKNSIKRLLKIDLKLKQMIFYYTIGKNNKVDEMSINLQYQFTIIKQLQQNNQLIQQDGRQLVTCLYQKRFEYSHFMYQKLGKITIDTYQAELIKCIDYTLLCFGQTHQYYLRLLVAYAKILLKKQNYVGCLDYITQIRNKLKKRPYRFMHIEHKLLLIEIKCLLCLQSYQRLIQLQQYPHVLSLFLSSDGKNDCSYSQLMLSIAQAYRHLNLNQKYQDKMKQIDEFIQNIQPNRIINIKYEPYLKNIYNEYANMNLSQRALLYLLIIKNILESVACKNVNIAQNYNSIGRAYQYLTDYRNASLYFAKSIKVIEQSSPLIQCGGQPYLNMYRICQLTKKYSDIIKYGLLFLNYNQKYPQDQNQVMKIINSVAVAYHKTGQDAKAFQFIQINYVKLSNIKESNEIFNSIMSIYLSLGDYQKYFQAFQNYSNFDVSTINGQKINECIEVLMRAVNVCFKILFYRRAIRYIQMVKVLITNKITQIALQIQKSGKPELNLDIDFIKQTNQQINKNQIVCIKKKKNKIAKTNNTNYCDLYC